MTTKNVVLLLAAVYLDYLGYGYRLFRVGVDEYDMTRELVFRYVAFLWQAGGNVGRWSLWSERHGDICPTTIEHGGECMHVNDVKAPAQTTAGKVLMPPGYRPAVSSVGRD
jgi:hypothetical protein